MLQYLCDKYVTKCNTLYVKLIIIIEIIFKYISVKYKLFAPFLLCFQLKIKFESIDYDFFSFFIIYCNRCNTACMLTCHVEIKLWRCHNRLLFARNHFYKSSELVFFYIYLKILTPSTLHERKYLFFNK